MKFCNKAKPKIKEKLSWATTMTINWKKSKWKKEAAFHRKKEKSP
jgi:hypothetical protein